LDFVLVFDSDFEGKQKFAFSRIALSIMSEGSELMQMFAPNSQSRFVESQAHDETLHRVHVKLLITTWKMQGMKVLAQPLNTLIRAGMMRLRRRGVQSFLKNWSCLKNIAVKR
jgi:hypothetical protein